MLKGTKKACEYTIPTYCRWVTSEYKEHFSVRKINNMCAFSPIYFKDGMLLFPVTTYIRFETIFPSELFRHHMDSSFGWTAHTDMCLRCRISYREYVYRVWITLVPFDNLPFLHLNTVDVYWNWNTMTWLWIVNVKAGEACVSQSPAVVWNLWGAA